MQPSSRNEPAAVRELTDDLLRRWPLPSHDGDTDKDERGSVLVVGATRSCPGAAMLAAVAALRAGAGKLQIATCRSIAQGIAIAIPEAAVFELPETDDGDIDAAAAERIAERAVRVDAVLIGPGMAPDATTAALLRRLLPRLSAVSLILDAGAMAVVKEDPRALQGRERPAILTPHAGEMAGMADLDKERVTADAERIARTAAERWGAVMVLKGGRTHIAAPGEPVYRFAGGGIGLATSGSGDTLAGLIAGLLARGADPLRAAAWGVYLHGSAGATLARRMGPIGFLARELLAEVPPLMARLGGAPLP